MVLNNPKPRFAVSEIAVSSPSIHKSNAAVPETSGTQPGQTLAHLPAVLPLMWEFPGGRVEENETDAQALRREVRHRLGAEIDVGKLISFVSHPYEHYVVDLFLYECTLRSGTLEGRMVNAYKWVTSAEFDQYPFTPADEASMNKLLGVA